MYVFVWISLEYTDGRTSTSSRLLVLCFCLCVCITVSGGISEGTNTSLQSQGLMILQSWGGEDDCAFFHKCEDHAFFFMLESLVYIKNDI